MVTIDENIKRKMKWETKEFSKSRLSNVYLVEGLPGMGNVGKIAIDFIIESTKAEKIYEIYSHSFPHCVFVTENNLIEVPSIKIYQKKIRNNNFIFIAGDIQPLDEASCYELCELLVDLFNKNKIKEIVTLGGIGQPGIPKKPKIYCTGTSKEIIKKYVSKDVSNSIYGVVGPIIGVSGVLLGVAQRNKINAITLLAETYGNPTYLGINESREILKVLNKKFNLKLDLSKMSIDVGIIEKDLKKKVKQIMKIKPSKKNKTDVNYIG